MSSSSQTPEPRPRRRQVSSLGTPCANCGHARNWHRYDDDTCSQCDCREYEATSPNKGGAS